jgi:hypothetical protein
MKRYDRSQSPSKASEGSSFLASIIAILSVVVFNRVKASRERIILTEVTRVWQSADFVSNANPKLERVEGLLQKLYDPVESFRPRITGDVADNKKFAISGLAGDALNEIIKLRKAISISDTLEAYRHKFEVTKILMKMQKVVA